MHHSQLFNQNSPRIAGIGIQHPAGEGLLVLTKKRLLVRSPVPASGSQVKLNPFSGERDFDLGSDQIPQHAGTQAAPAQKLWDSSLLSGCVWMVRDVRSASYIFAAELFMICSVCSKPGFHIA